MFIDPSWMFHKDLWYPLINVAESSVIDRDARLFFGQSFPTNLVSYLFRVFSKACDPSWALSFSIYTLRSDVADRSVDRRILKKKKNDVHRPYINTIIIRDTDLGKIFENTQMTKSWIYRWDSVFLYFEYFRILRQCLFRETIESFISEPDWERVVHACDPYRLQLNNFI